MLVTAHRTPASADLMLVPAHQKPASADLMLVPAHQKPASADQVLVTARQKPASADLMLMGAPILDVSEMGKKTKGVLPSFLGSRIVCRENAVVIRDARVTT